MGDQHPGRIDHGAPPRQRFFPQPLLDPKCRQAEGRLRRALPGQGRHLAGRVDRQLQRRAQLAAPGLNLLDPQHIGIGRQFQIVLDPHARQHEAHLLRHAAAKLADLLSQPRRIAGREREQPVAQLQSQQVKPQRLGDRWLGRCRDRRRWRRRLLQGRLPQDPGKPARPPSQQQEGQYRHPRQGAQHRRRTGGERQRLPGADQLPAHCLIRPLLTGPLGDHDAGGDRDEECRDLADQAIADGQQGKGIGRLGDRQAMPDHGDRQAADQVDGGDDKARHGIAADEFGGAVHGAMKGAFLLQLPPPAPGFRFIDQSGREIGIDRHLLARHGIQAEARSDLGDTAGALGHHHEVHDEQDGEDNQPHHHIAAHQEAAEGGNDMARRLRALMPMGQDGPRRGDIERKTQQGGQQQHLRKCREIERPAEE